MTIRLMCSLVVSLFSVGLHAAEDGPPPCVCPYYFYAGGPGGYYCYSWNHDPDCPTKTSIADTVSSYAFGNCDNECTNCHPLKRLLASTGGNQTKESCCEGTAENTSIKELPVHNVSQKSEEQTEDVTGDRIAIPFKEDEIPVDGDFKHDDFHPGPWNQPHEVLNVLPFGPTYVLKYCPADCDEGDEMYLLVLLYTHENSDDASLLLAFAFEMSPTAAQKETAKWLAPGMVRKIPGPDGKPLSDQLFINWGVISFVGFVDDVSKWVP